MIKKMNVRTVTMMILIHVSNVIANRVQRIDGFDGLSTTHWRILRILRIEYNGLTDFTDKQYNGLTDFTDKQSS